ncbi:MAG: EthD domain-containing protein [Acidimicrobiia bacterium]
MTVIAAVLGAIPDGADLVYVPVEEGVSGRDDGVVAIAVFRSGARPPLDRAEAYRVDDHVQWDDGRTTVARISFVRRAPGLTRAEFARHWTDVHAPLARRHHPGICRYVQNIVVEPLTPGAPEVDGIAELGFASVGDLRERMYDSPEGKEIIAADVRTFLDVGGGWRMLARRAR